MTLLKRRARAVKIIKNGIVSCTHAVVNVWCGENGLEKMIKKYER